MSRTKQWTEGGNVFFSVWRARLVQKDFDIALHEFVVDVTALVKMTASHLTEVCESSGNVSNISKEEQRARPLDFRSWKSLNGPLLYCVNEC